MMEKIYIKNKKMFKSKKQMVSYIIIFLVLIGMFIYLGSIDYKDKTDDKERFSLEFSMVSKDNVFKYANANEVRALINNKNGIVLFGTKNEWVNYYAYTLNKVAKEVGIKEIYYYDFIKNRQDNNGTYEDIVNKLSNYVTYNDKGKGEIYAPTLLVIKNGKVILFDTDTSFVSGEVTPSIYWNSYTTGEKEQELKVVFKEYLES